MTAVFDAFDRMPSSAQITACFVVLVILASADRVLERRWRS